ncbi:hypothetical protein [Ottowia caeni]|uniref:hypothetical protein n=1 Tax=Ottowia caeni TaxID=2870339 RepID=UPI001E2CE064|nr:hypothetical protein [Ottowia caeni]
MKKSLLALGAVAALGGLGFSGAANAVWVVDSAANATAQTLSASTDTGVGHILVTPYFSTAGSTGTLLTVVNTDTTNGKAVKVRFRGAANSDDVLDFTVLLSPGDVWSASVAQGADGFSRMSSPDTSCVLPAQPTGEGVAFSDARLDTRLTAEARAAHTQEGYVEWLTMADIRPGTRLFTATKHKLVGGQMVAPCTSDVMAELMDPTTTMNVDEASAFGLTAPTGGLMGNWTIYNSGNVTSYGGANSAIVALDTTAVPPAPASARLFFAPQIGASNPTFPPNGGDVAWSTGTHLGETADPLLTNFDNGGPAGGPILQMLPFDLPDLSTPYVSGFGFAAAQSTALSAAMATSAVMNEWTAGSDNGVNFSTDWVFSQPTRRYHAAVNYGTGGATPAAVYNSLSSPFFYPPASMVKKTLGANGAFGTVLCLQDGIATYHAYNREEATIVPTFNGEWSPGTPVGKTPGFCGEVAVLTFGEQSKALNAQLTTYQIGSLPSGGAGWMSVGLPGVTTIGEATYAGGLPVIGYAANTFNTSVGSMVGNYGDAVTHRYKRPSGPAPAIVLPAPAVE